MEALAHAPKKELLSIKGISEAKVEKIQKEGTIIFLPGLPLSHRPDLCEYATRESPLFFLFKG